MTFMYHNGQPKKPLGCIYSCFAKIHIKNRLYWYSMHLTSSLEDHGTGNYMSENFSIVWWAYWCYSTLLTVSAYSYCSWKTKQSTVQVWQLQHWAVESRRRWWWVSCQRLVAHLKTTWESIICCSPTSSVPSINNGGISVELLSILPVYYCYSHGQIVWPGVHSCRI